MAASSGRGQSDPDAEEGQAAVDERTPLLLDGGAAGPLPASSNPGEDTEASRSGLSTPGSSPTLGPSAASPPSEESDGDAAADDDDEEPPKPTFLIDTNQARFWLCFLEVMLTYLIATFDGTIMASSHPVITSHFGASNSASWLSTAFLLTATAFQPLVGRLSDSLGRKGLYVGSMALFTAATAWCALAQSIGSFIAARAFCGLGAGGMMTLGAIIVSDLVPIERRGAYQSYINIVYGVGSSLGAALGGAMADSLGWRWEFGVQVPVLVLGVVLAILAVPADLGLQGRERETLREALGNFDLRGSLLLTPAVTSLILGLNLGGNVLPWDHPFVISSLSVFAVCFPLFLYSETLAKRPILPLHLIRKPPHMNLIFANFFAAFLTHATLFNIPLFFQGVLLTSATASGLHLLVPTIVSSAAGTLTGFLITATRRLKWPLVLGASLYLLGALSLAAMRPGWPEVWYLLALAPTAAGQGFQFPGTFLAVLAASPQRAQAVVTSTLVLWRGLGMVLGIAASSLVLQNALVGYLDEFVRHGAAGSPAEREQVIRLVRGSVAAVRDLDDRFRPEVVRSYEAALRTTFLSLAVVAAVSLVLIVPVRLPRLGQARR